MATDKCFIKFVFDEIENAGAIFNGTQHFHIFAYHTESIRLNCDFDGRKKGEKYEFNR